MRAARWRNPLFGSYRSKAAAADGPLERDTYNQHRFDANGLRSAVFIALSSGRLDGLVAKWAGRGSGRGASVVPRGTGRSDNE